MAIANFNEILMNYTKRLSALNQDLSQNIMNTVSATRSYANEQQKFNDKLDDYRELYLAIGDEEGFKELEEMLNHEHDLSMKRLESWEATLEAEKNQIELEISQVTANKNNFTKLLGNNIKKDFSYGGTAK